MLRKLLSTRTFNRTTLIVLCVENVLRISSNRIRWSHPIDRLYSVRTLILAYPRSTIAFGPDSTHRCANPSYESHTENVYANTKDVPCGCGSVLSILYDMQMTYRLAASRKYVTNIFRGTQHTYNTVARAYNNIALLC